MKKIVVACILAFAAPLAQANFISFMNIADGDTATSDGSILTGAAGEAGWQPFEWDFGGGLILTVRGFETSGAESYAYLDKGKAEWVCVRNSITLQATNVIHRQMTTLVLVST
jgi:hypothetical protein